MNDKTCPTPSCSTFEFIVLMVMLVSLTALSIDSVLPALGIMGKALSVSDPNNMQFVISALFAGFTIGQLLYGPLSDAMGRKPTIYIGLTVFLFGTVICLMAQSLTVLLIGRTLQGLGAASPRINSIAITRDLYAGREMARISSIIMAFFIFVPVVAPAIGQVILHFSNWQGIFMMLFVVAVLAMVWFHFRLEETLTPQKRNDLKASVIMAGVKEFMSHKVARGYMICGGFMFGVLVSYLVLAQQVFLEYYDVGERFALYFAFSALSIGGGSALNSTIVRRFGMRLIGHYALIGIITTSALMLGALYVMGGDMPLWGFITFLVISFLFLGICFGNFNAIAMEPMGHIAGVASSVIGAGGSAISVIIGTMIGQLYNQTHYPFVIGFLILGVLSFIIQLPLRRESLAST